MLPDMPRNFNLSQDLCISHIQLELHNSKLRIVRNVWMGVEIYFDIILVQNKVVK